jgi:uncharacterized protein (DUF3820 family)
MYTGETTLGFGKYKGMEIRHIPKDYLLKIYRDGHPDTELMEYIKCNIKIKEKIKEKEVKYKFEDTISVSIHGTNAKLICKDSNKIIFISEKDAKYEIRRIQNLQQENKKPTRTYECEKCGGWHLTSIPHERWEIVKKLKK